MWTRLRGAIRPSWIEGKFRVTRLATGLFSLASYQDDCRYWRFLGEYDSAAEAKERAALIAQIEMRNAVNPARAALSRAVNRAVAEGGPTYTNKAD